MRRFQRFLVLLVLAILWIAVGCGEEGMLAPNGEPDTRITGSQPKEGGSTSHHIEFLFTGGDFDGRVEFYEYLIETYPPSVDTIDDITLVTPAQNDSRWMRVDVARVQTIVLADILRADPRGDIGTGEFDRWHTFYVRSVDNAGARDSTPDHVTFRAVTMAPEMWINRPAIGGQNIIMPSTFVVNWDGTDPIGNFDFQDVQDARWTLQPTRLDAVGNPVGFPDTLYDLPESAWSDWVAWGSPDSLGREAVFRDMTIPGALDKSFVFALQGRDDGGAITPKFKNEAFRKNNMTVITVSSSLLNGPQLTVFANGDTPLGSWDFNGIGAPGVTVSTMADSVSLSWQPMRAAHYGANRGEFRFGWNIQNPELDEEWTEWEPFLFATPRKSLEMSTEEFRLQARDHIGQVTTAVITFTKF